MVVEIALVRETETEAADNTGWQEWRKYWLREKDEGGGAAKDGKHKGWLNDTNKSRLDPL